MNIFLFICQTWVEEARQVYLPLGFEPSNIYAADLDKKAYERAQKDNQSLSTPIQLRHDNAVNVLGEEKFFDVISLDFAGTYGKPVSTTLSDIFGNPHARNPEFITYVAVQARRDSDKARKRLTALPSSLLAGVAYQASVAAAHGRVDIPKIQNPFSINNEAIVAQAEELIGLKYNKTLNAAIRAALISEVATHCAFPTFRGQTLDEMLHSYQQTGKELESPMTKTAEEYLTSLSYRGLNTDDALVLAAALEMMPDADVFSQQNNGLELDYGFTHAFGSFPNDIEHTHYTSASGTPMSGFRAHFKPVESNLDEELHNVLGDKRYMAAFVEMFKFAQSQEPAYRLFRKHLERVKPKNLRSFQQVAKGFRVGEKVMIASLGTQSIAYKTYITQLKRCGKLLDLVQHVSKIGIEINEAKAGLLEYSIDTNAGEEKQPVFGFLEYNTGATIDNIPFFRQPTAVEMRDLKEMKWNRMGQDFATSYFADEPIATDRIKQLYAQFRAQPIKKNTVRSANFQPPTSQKHNSKHKYRDLTVEELRNMEVLAESYDLEGILKHFAFHDEKIGFSFVREYHDALTESSQRLLTAEEKEKVRKLVDLGIPNDDIVETLGNNIRPASIYSTIARHRCAESWAELRKSKLIAS